MSIKIKTPYLKQFSMPGMCVSCGGLPDSPTKWQVSHHTSIGRTNFTLMVPFPVCRRCAETGRDSEKGGKLGMLGLALAFFGLVMSFAFVKKSTGSESTAAVAALVVSIAIFAFFTWLKNRADQAGFTAKQRMLRKKVKNCAGILFFAQPGILDQSGEIQFKFENEAFAEQFGALNDGKVM